MVLPQTSHMADRNLSLLVCIFHLLKFQSPGNSRLIFISGRNFAVGIDRIVPRWTFHINQNLVIDSDLYLLHIEVLERLCNLQEKKLMQPGFSNWEKACFVPTKSDAKVVAFRKWLKKYSGGRIDWGNHVS
ncbi:putative pheophorbide a oxygenase [Helianthus anomalus]